MLLLWLLLGCATASETTIGVLTDDTGCPSGCSTAASPALGAQVAAADYPPSVSSYTGGSSCSGGNNICSCDWPGTWVNGAPAQCVPFHASSMCHPSDSQSAEVCPARFASLRPRSPSASDPNSPGGVQITVFFTATSACSDSTDAASWGYSACTADDVANRLTKNFADATRCREACRTFPDSGVGGCNFAHFGFWGGYCHIFSWETSYLTGGGSCPRMCSDCDLIAI